MNFLTAWNDGVRAAIAAAWPDVVANGIYRELEITRLTLADKADAQELPYATFARTGVARAEAPSTGGAYLGELMIHRIQRDDYDLDALDEEMEALRDYLFREGALPVGQVTGTPVILTDLDVPANRFFRNTLRPFVAGAVSAPFEITWVNLP